MNCGRNPWRSSCPTAFCKGTSLVNVAQDFLQVSLRYFWRWRCRDGQPFPMFVIVVNFFFSIISFGISFVATCAYLLLLVVHLQEFPLYFQPSVRSFETTVSVPLSFVILLKTDNSFNFSVCIFMFQPSNHLDDFLLYSFQNTYIFLEVEKSIQNTPDTLSEDNGEVPPWEGN